MLTVFSALSFAEVKQADKAGSWYPSDEKELRGMLNAYLEKAAPLSVDGDIIGLISPHAGYAASGPVAAFGYKLLKGRGIKTAVIVGFNHSLFHRGIAVCDYDSYRTPLGTVPVNKEISRALIDQHDAIYAARNAFYDEQSTEMQVPFAQMVLKDFQVVIVSIGKQSFNNSEIISTALYNVLKDRSDYVIIGSTDLSHYLPYDRARQVDDYTVSLMQRFDPLELFSESAKKGHGLMCGYGAVSAVLMACKKLGADEVVTLKYANSGDTLFDKRKVVGYMSAALVRTETKGLEAKNEVSTMLNADQQKKMLKLARDSITLYLRDGKRLEVKEDDPVLNEEMGAFVTLHKNGQLRGCIGNMIGRGPFYLTVRDMAIEAATGDPRFPKVRSEEMKDIDIEISALSPLKKITDPEEIVVGKHGVLVRQGFRSGVYLPQVATETGWNKEEFMTSLCGQKAGISPDAWKKGECEISVFTAEVFGEKGR